MNKIYTTGDVAEFCHVAPRTVANWMDNGLLPGYRIPGSKDRRFYEADVIGFMQEHGIALQGISGLGKRILVIGVTKDFLKDLQKVLSVEDGYLVETAANLFDAGYRTASFGPHIVLVDLAMGDLDAGCLASSIKPLATTMAVIALTSEGTMSHIKRLGFDDAFDKGMDLSFLVHQIERTIQVARRPKATKLTEAS